MEQSATVREVLSSEEFRYWLPDEMVYVEWIAVPKLGQVVIISLAAGLVAGIAGYLKGSPFAAAYGVGLAVVVLLCLTLFFGFAKTRVIRFSERELQVSASNGYFFRVPWDEVLDVRPTGRWTFEIVTKQGTATVWEPLARFDDSDYSMFFLNVLYAMAYGVRADNLRRYRVPVSLVEGKAYVYKGLEGLKKKILGAQLTAIAAIAFMLAEVFWKRDLLAFVGGSLTLMSSWIVYAAAKDKVERMSHRTLVVRDGRIAVEGGSEPETYAFHKLSQNRSPQLKPEPFDRQEVYGEESKHIKVDRRFLAEASSD
ncbi:MAG: hypothetical protein JST12_04555 [Armatimonadetes bacterium]|nr:hypothetical protein [Armatimonadota bacterium]